MQGQSQRGLQKEKDVRLSNIIAAKGVADAIRTSLGPRGMDKMIQNKSKTTRKWPENEKRLKKRYYV